MPAKTETAPADGAGVIDLDARKAARLESTGEKTVRFGGEDWLFKPELPMQTVEDFTNGDMQSAFAKLLVDPDRAAAFLAAGDISQQDMAELMRAVYGLELPNS
jgi:hypothetical protein